MKTSFRFSSFNVFAALLAVVCLAGSARAACTCDPNVSYGTPSDPTATYNGSTVDVNVGNTETEFVTAAYTQIYGSAPSTAQINTMLANFTNYSWWRRIDTVNQLLNQAGSNLTKTYSNRWAGTDPPYDTAPCKTEARDVGAVCMFFFDCEGGTNCTMDWANTHTEGMNGFSALYQDNDSNGFYNSATNVGFWYTELMDARYAGLSFLLPNAYGPDITNGSISNLASALTQISNAGTTSQVQIGLMDDTTGWGVAAYPAPFNAIPNMSDTGTDSNSAAYDIEKNKWAPFFNLVPKADWFLVNGRPLIYFYNGGTLAYANSAAVIQSAKALFYNDFGVYPYVAVDSYFFADTAMNTSGTNADNEFIWDTLHAGAQTGLTQNFGSDLTLSSFTDSNGVVLDHSMVKWDPIARNAMAGNGGVMPTEPNLPVAVSGPSTAPYYGPSLIKDDSYLIETLQNSHSATILTLATWNDLGEGTGINRQYDYYWSGAWQQPNTFMDDIRADQSQQTCGTILSTPTATPTPHGPLVQDFADNAENNVTYWNFGNITQYNDANTTTSVPNPPGWTASSATSWTVTGTPPGYTGTAGYAGCWSGVIAADTDSPYPYSFMALELTPGGSVLADLTSGAYVSVVPYATNQGLSFDYKGNTGVSYEVQLTTKEITNYNYYSYTFTPPDTNWHTLNVYFPGVNSADVFALPGGATTPAFDPTAVGAVMFQVIAQSKAAAYNLCVDDVTFDAPVPTPYATPTHGPMVQDFATPTANNVTYWNGGGLYQYVDGYGTTSNHTPWTATSATSWTVTGTPPGYTGTAGYAGCWAGTLTGTSTTAPGPYSFMALELIPGGSISSSSTGGAWTSVVPYAANSGLQFEYQAAAAGVTYQVQLATKEVTNYNYYQYTFVSTDTAWHTLDVYFPGVSAPDVFTLPGGGTSPAFDPTEVGAVIFQVVPQPDKNVGYGLCVDAVTFDCPAPPTPTATATITPSASSTVTPTVTRSFSPTATPSSTPTPSSTVSFSPTVSASASDSPTHSPVDTPTDSVTPSPTWTPSPYESSTPSATPSASWTPSPHESSTPSATPSSTWTSTPYESPTPSATPTVSASQTVTLSVSPSLTVSMTASPSSTVSPEATASPSSTVTPSATPSHTPQATATPSLTGSQTATVTDTPTAGSPLPSATPAGASQPFKIVPCPNPQHGPVLNFKVYLQAPSDGVVVKIYSQAFVIIQETQVGTAQLAQGWNLVSFSLNQPLPRGLYYVVLEGQQGGKTTHLGAVARLVYL